MDEKAVISPGNILTRQLPPLADYLRMLSYEVHDALIPHIDPHVVLTLSPRELGQEIEDFIAAFVASRGIQLNRREQQQIATNIVYNMVGFGPLEPLFFDESITDIMVNGPNEIYIERHGKLEKSTVTFRDQQHILQIAQRIATGVGRRIDESSPTVDARLPDGNRVNIVLPPVSLNGPIISIRKFSKKPIDMQTLIKMGTISENFAAFMEIIAACRLNVLISGSTSAGKTTLMNAISHAISPLERIITIEDAAELRLQQPHVIRLETRSSNVEGEGAITVRALVKNALRMRPDRIIVGEVRGDETIDMLQAMNTGHDGSMSTIHANNAREALWRLENMVLISEGIPSKVIRAQILGGLNIVIQIERMRDGVRRVKEIIELTHLDGENLETQVLFAFDFKGEDKKGRLLGDFVPKCKTPKFMERARYYGLEAKLKEIIG
ncbi:MAG: CpaF family protein [Alphaproteobacteria bacterium]